MDAALLVLNSMGLSPQDLTNSPGHRPGVPTFAEYVPVVSAGVTDGMGTALAHMLREDHVACRV